MVMQGYCQVAQSKRSTDAKSIKNVENRKNAKKVKFSQEKALQIMKMCSKIALAVTLIAMKREVATVWKRTVGFPWSECQVRKLATSHCTILYSAICRKCG